ncbi:MAG: hypothetical protein LUC98_04965 [Lachnospiraceae bacterium]|nr:hypothetical protein [Lachnospiraceae bacterium]
MKRRISAAILILCLVIAKVPGALAYQTDISEPLLNHTTIALDSVSTLVEYYPSVLPELTSETNTIDYTKLIQVANTGYVDEYIRVKLIFSDSDIESKTFFSSDKNNYYSPDEYSRHLPDGWVYHSSDGFYYYTGILEAGNWEEYASDLTYDASNGQYYYKDANFYIAPIITTPLVQYMKTVFDEPVDMRSYYLYAYEESVPFYFGSDYAEAWENYLADYQ